MKSYLSLIPISAKVHRRQNRMTILCIIFSVFMVTAIFSMAEMGGRMELSRLQEKHEGFSLKQILDSSMGQQLLLVAGVLCLLILIAGVLMISGSINSSVTQRTKFFGMMRCIGMSKKQISHFVHLEALNWCKTAIPIGLGLGIIVSWGLCAFLRFGVGEEFTEIPQFGISIIGIISGVLIGTCAVLIAASSPAKRAAKVSPATAASGNYENAQIIHHSKNGRLLKIETRLGIHHAMADKKNFMMMLGSFALSIILFLCFSVLISFVNYLMPQSAGRADMEVSSNDGLNSIDCKLIETLGQIDGVKHVYGRRSDFNVQARIEGQHEYESEVDVISFDDFDLECLEKDKLLKSGSKLQKVYGENKGVIVTCDNNSSVKIGDKLFIKDEVLEVAGMLKYDLFSSDGLTHGKMTIITSGETYIDLMGDDKYSLILIQTTSNISDENVQQIKTCLGKSYLFRDKREESTSGTYLAFVTCVYGFLSIVTIVTILNIVNSISMSVSARIKQYGAMRAVGMDGHQITKMILAEAFTYGIMGSIVGCLVGLALSKSLYDFLITNHFPYAIWRVPFFSIAVIFGVVLLAVIAAIYAPVKRLRTMSVTDTISEL